MSSATGLRRPKSQFFTNAEKGVKRITTLFTPSTDNLALRNNAGIPPTPPLGPRSRANSLYFANEPPVPQFPPNMPLPSPSPSVSSYGGSTRDRSNFGARQYAGNAGSLSARHHHTPTSAVFGDNGEILQAPVAPFAAASRPSSRGSGAFSRPGTSSGSITPGQAKPVEVPRLRKKKQGKKKDDDQEPPCWRLAPNGSSSAGLQEFDYSPLVRGEPVCGACQLAIIE